MTGVHEGWRRGAASEAVLGPEELSGSGAGEAHDPSHQPQGPAAEGGESLDLNNNLSLP